jgi:nitroreductase
MAHPDRPESPTDDPVTLLEGIATTRTIRRYRDEAIDEETLASILWHASRAPNGSNRQPVRYMVLRDGETDRAARAVLGRVARDVWARKEQADGYTAGSGAEPDSPKARMAATMRHYVEHFHEAPVIVLVCLVRYREPNAYEGASVYPAVQNLLLAARGLGLGGAVTMWQTMVDGELREILGIPPEAALSACVTLGYPVGHHGPVRRRPLSGVVYDGTWGNEAVWAADPPGTRFTQWR